MPLHFGPFQFVYTVREQKLRDTMKHLIHKFGMHKARLLVTDEYIKTADQLGADSPQAIWWNDIRWHLKSFVHSLNYGFEKGL